jgi:LytS/YehU family sensor histidine kinase
LSPRLLFCLVTSILTGLLLGGLCISAGWGWLAGLLAYSFGGSVALVATSLAVAAISSVPQKAAAREVPRSAEAGAAY